MSPEELKKKADEINGRKTPTLNEIREAIQEVYNTNPFGVTSYINEEEGIEAYTIRTPGATITMGREGLKRFNEAMRAEFERTQHMWEFEESLEMIEASAKLQGRLDRQTARQRLSGSDFDI